MCFLSKYDTPEICTNKSENKEMGRVLEPPYIHTELVLIFMKSGMEEIIKVKTAKNDSMLHGTANILVCRGGCDFRLFLCYKNHYSFVFL